MVSRAEQARAALQGIADPEIPAISIVDLGIVRDVVVSDDGASVEVEITPTYSGCPALAVIEQAIGDILGQSFDTVRVRTVLDPPWTTDWITPRGLSALKESGIAPPRPRPFAADATATMAASLPLVGGAPEPEDSAPEACPRCDSRDIERLAEFGSTACKALWRCRSCGDPFDYFRPLRHRASA